MKNLQSVLIKPGLQDKIERTKKYIRGEEGRVFFVDEVIKEFTERIVDLVGLEDWGIFLGRTNEWMRDLSDENMKFINTQEVQNEITATEQEINTYLRERSDGKGAGKGVLKWLAQKIAMEARLKIHELTRPESNSPGIGNTPPEAYYVDLM